MSDARRRPLEFFREKKKKKKNVQNDINEVLHYKHETTA